MPSLELSARRNGLLVEVWVWLSAARREEYYKLNRQPPPKQWATLIVDTGADTTMLSDQLMRSLELTSTSQTRVFTSTSPAKGDPCDVYDVSLELLNKAGDALWAVQPLQVLARDMHQGIDGMLGRDVLSLCVLQYNGPTGTFRLDFPNHPTRPVKA